LLVELDLLVVSIGIVEKSLDHGPTQEGRASAGGFAIKLGGSSTSSSRLTIPQTPYAASRGHQRHLRFLASCPGLDYCPMLASKRLVPIKEPKDATKRIEARLNDGFASTSDGRGSTPRASSTL
jgi:hypothetical protein